tara:strand:+ start:10520 stop:13300 length:2781 start_codon:yes stop_codon:yes gene_type:complete
MKNGISIYRERYGSHSLRAMLLATAGLCIVGGYSSHFLQPAHAQTTANGAQQDLESFVIATQDLNAALLQYADLAGVRLIFPSQLASGRRSSGISGFHSREEALWQLLEGTGLVFHFSDARTVVIADPTSSVIDTSEEDGSLMLDVIDVTERRGETASGSGFQGTPDRVYETAESLSVISREAVENSAVRDTRDLMVTVPGVYSGQGNGSFPTVSPNIRGLQDSGRVVVSIDGARQNAQRGFGTGGSGYQSNAGQAYVDSAFVRTVEIGKNPDASSGNAASLGGSVDFRTVGADDLIQDGRNWGGEINGTTGTNKYNFRGSILAAARIRDTPFSITGGFSGLDLGEYLAGQNGGEPNYLGNFKGRESWASFVKLEGDFGEAETSLSWIHQENEFKYGAENFTNSEHVRNDSVTARLAWNPDSNLIDFKGNIWYNNSQTNETRASRESVGGAPETYIDLGLQSFGLALENTSRFVTSTGPLTLNYGVEAFRDVATASANSATIAITPEFDTSYKAFSPPGNRDIASGFASAQWEPMDWLTLTGGLRYDWYRLHGSATYFNRETTIKDTTRRAEAITAFGEWAQVNQPDTYNTYFDFCNNHENPAARAYFCGRLTALGEVIDDEWTGEGQWVGEVVTTTEYPAYDVAIDREGGAWLPTARMEFKPVDWFQPYVSYSQSFRPATITESFFAGGPPGDVISTNYAPNILLRPEQARTVEIGANVKIDGVFRSDDRFRLKATAFDREIDDYVVLGYILSGDVPDRTYLSFVNLDGVTRMRGVELEGNYDAGRYWLGGAVTWLKTEWPQSTEIFSNGAVTTSGEIYATAGEVPPKLKVTLDGGVRLFEDDLTIGMRMNHVTPTLSRRLDGDGNLTKQTRPFTTLDLYGSYRFDENATLHFAGTNLTDVNYVPATGSYNAPGRTFTSSLKLKF